MSEDPRDRSAEIVALFPEEDPRTPTPRESLRLIAAFLAVSNLEDRLQIIRFAESLVSKGESGGS